MKATYYHSGKPVTAYKLDVSCECNAGLFFVKNERGDASYLYRVICAKCRKELAKIPHKQQTMTINRPVSTETTECPKCGKHHWWNMV